jgi:hypothetical protein
MIFQVVPGVNITGASTVTADEKLGNDSTDLPALLYGR